MQPIPQAFEQQQQDIQSPNPKQRFSALAYSGPEAWQAYLTQREAIIHALAEGFIGYAAQDASHDYAKCAAELQKDCLYLAKIYAEYLVHCYLPDGQGHLVLVFSRSAGLIEERRAELESVGRGRVNEQEEVEEGEGGGEVVGVLLGANSWAGRKSTEKPPVLQHLYTNLISPLIKHTYPPGTPSPPLVPPSIIETYELAPRASFLGVVPACRGKGAARAMFDAWHAHVEGMQRSDEQEDKEAAGYSAALTAVEPGELVQMYEHLGYRAVKRYRAKMLVEGDEFEFVDMLRVW